MAKYDIVETASVFGAGFGTPTLTFANPPAAGNLILIAFSMGNFRTATVPPSGFTLITSWLANPDAGRWYFYAKVAGASEPATYTVGIDDSTNGGFAAVVIEGPFTSVAAVSFSAREYNSGNDVVTVSTAPRSLPSAGVAIAYLTSVVGSFGDALSWSNSFVGRPKGGANGCSTHWATRVYPSANSGVQTVATLSGGTFGSYWMVLVNEESGSAPAGRVNPISSLISRLFGGIIR
jgi:hypothetical protein